MKQIIKVALLCMALAGLLTGCSAGDLALQREKNAGQGEQVVIGVPVPLEFARNNTNFLNGIDLALEEINSTGVNGKKVELEIVDDQGNFKAAVDIAQEFSKNSRMLAVIGHWFSDICIPVSNIYEEAGMLTMVPTVSNPGLTEKGYQYIFQSIVNDKKIAREIADYAKSMGYKQVVVYYEESSYGINLADAIEEEALAGGLKVVDRRSGLATAEQFEAAHDKWQALEFDAVLLALNMPEGANFIRQLRKMDGTAGIIAADGLDVGNFIEELGSDAEGVVITTTYSPNMYNSELESFRRKYQEKYAGEPDVWAIQGYEALQFIVQAMRQTKSFSPAVLADYLHDMAPLPTILGKVNFNEDGEVEGRKIYKKTVNHGVFEYMD
ncbi:MAG: ABC transporter substrate-binding protein [Peptococcaceae bacterium]